MAEHLVCCGGLNSSCPHALHLALNGPLANVVLSIEDIERRLLTEVSDELLDLLDIAAYLYAADGAVQRGSEIDRRFGSSWRRPIRFMIPVRKPELWSSDSVRSALVEILNFLADRNHYFEFHKLAAQPPTSRYFTFGSNSASFAPDEIILFSGGLDSFAGAVTSLVGQRSRVALVSHRSVNTIGAAQSALVRELRRCVTASQLLHIQVHAHLRKGLAKEYTQRTRSFLFAAIGFVTARLFGIDRISFFENGVVSLNLPPVAQVVGARATRTTHPHALHGFRQLFSAILNSDFSVTNPFMWLTKAEVIGRAVDHGFVELLRDTRSCSRVMEMTIQHPHCGSCSQCIDRRFGMLAARVGEADPTEAYRFDLFNGARPKVSDKEMALSYVRMANSISGMTDTAFFTAYGELSRAVNFMDERPDVAAQKTFDLFQRHAAGVCRVVDSEIRLRASEIRSGSLPWDCLLALITAQSAGHLSYAAPASHSAPVSDNANPRIRIALDEQTKTVILEGLGELTGVSSELIQSLVRAFRRAREGEVAPENYPYVKTSELLKQFGLADEETLRKRVHRCRKAIAAMVSEAGGNEIDEQTVIESLPWHGYRLNPDVVQIVALSAIRR